MDIEYDGYKMEFEHGRSSCRSMNRLSSFQRNIKTPDAERSADMRWWYDDGHWIIDRTWFLSFGRHGQSSFAPTRALLGGKDDVYEYVSIFRPLFYHINVRPNSSSIDTVSDLLIPEMSGGYPRANQHRLYRFAESTIWRLFFSYHVFSTCFHVDHGLNARYEAPPAVARLHEPSAEGVMKAGHHWLPWGISIWDTIVASCVRRSDTACYSSTWFNIIDHHFEFQWLNKRYKSNCKND